MEEAEVVNPFERDAENRQNMQKRRAELRQKASQYRRNQQNPNTATLKQQISKMPISKAKSVGAPTQTAKSVGPTQTIKASGTPPKEVTKGDYTNKPFPKASAVKNSYNVKDKGPTTTLVDPLKKEKSWWKDKFPKTTAMLKGKPDTTVKIGKATADAATSPKPPRDNSGVSDSSRFWSATAGKPQFDKSKNVPEPSTTLKTQDGKTTYNNPGVTGAKPAGPSKSLEPPAPTRKPTTRADKPLNRPNPQIQANRTQGQAGSKSGPVATPAGPSTALKAAPAPTPVTKAASRPPAVRARGVSRPKPSSGGGRWGFHGTATRTAPKNLSAGQTTNRALGGVWEEKIPEVVKESFESFIRNTFLKENNE